MNEVTRWVLGIFLTLILGAYGYAWATARDASAANDALETRIGRQLDIIEHKVDRVLEYQFNERKRQ